MVREENPANTPIERAHPFVIASGIFGGGGYFLIALGADGREQLEVSLEC